MIRTRFWAVAVLAVVWSAAQAPPARAVFTTFTNRNAFNANLAANPSLTVTTQTYDGFPDGFTFADGATVGGVTYDLVSPNGQPFIVTSDFFALSFPNSLGRTVGQEFFAGDDTITFSFAQPVFAFGISFNTFATATGTYTLTVTAGEPGVAPSFLDPFPLSTTGQFAGFTATAGVTSVTLSGATAFTYTLDNLTFATASGAGVVPEPASLALAGLGALGLAGYRARRRAAAAA